MHLFYFLVLFFFVVVLLGWGFFGQGEVSNRLTVV